MTYGPFMDLLGFWSYVHADDQVDMGRVTQLAKDIVGHYEAIRAETINLFLDRDDLHWGDEWRAKVDESLANVAFFIPVITPRYFTRVECRREFQFFVNRTEALGISQLILPILYIDVPELHEDMPSDPLVQNLKKFQWESWIPYRFEDRASGEYMGSVNALAQELVRRVREVEAIDVVAAVVSADETSEDADLGTLDRIAALEEAMPRWTETMEAIRAEIEQIGELARRGGEDMNAGNQMGKAFAARLTVARRLAAELGGPVGRIETLGQAFASDLAEIDSGVRVLLEVADDAVHQPMTDPDRDQLRGFLGSLGGLANSSREGLGSIEQMITAMRPIEGLSKDMRAPLRKLRGSLTAMLEARDITVSWADAAAAIDIDCAGRSPAQS